jgi:site-specific DNA recombinase
MLVIRQTTSVTASIEDQLRICREQAKREKRRIVATYKDAAISGASMILRPGIQTLLRDAQARQFDVVLADALDRISRDQADTATLFKHLKFAGVPIGTLAEGEISELHVGLKGHNERAVPERSCCQNASRRARPHRAR